MKKAISLILAFALLFSTAVGAYAAPADDAAADEAASLQKMAANHSETQNVVTIGDITGKIGDTVSVPIYVDALDKISLLMLAFTYDHDKLTLGSPEYTLNTEICSSCNFKKDRADGSAILFFDWVGAEKSVNGWIADINFTITGTIEDGDIPIEFSPYKADIGEDGLSGTELTDISNNYFTMAPDPDDSSVAGELLTYNGSVKARHYYSVIFDSNGGSEVAAQEIASGGKATEPTAPTKAGMRIDGWYTDNFTFENRWDFSTNTVENAEVTLYAKWIPDTHELVFNSNGGSAVEKQDVLRGATATAPAVPTKTGFNFKGWYKDNETFEMPWNFATDVMGENDINVYAKWEVKKFNIFFESNGGTPTATQLIDYNKNATEPAAPEKTGHIFGGWQYNNNGTLAAWNFGSMAVTDSDITLYAQWTAESYSVTFDSNGGSGVDALTLDYGSKIPQPADIVNLTSSGDNSYTFGGWYTDDDTFLVPWVFSSDIVTGETTLHAKWIEVASNQRVVTFEPAGGSAVAPAIATSGSTVATEPTAPSKPGYDFTGWYTDKAATPGNEWNPTTDTVADNTTVYAGWTPKNYEVTFNSNGGTAVNAQTIACGATITKPATPSKADSIFCGWYSDAEFANAWDFSSNTIGAADMTLFAKWIGANEGKVVVSFDGNGGTSAAAEGASDKAAAAPQIIDSGATVTQPVPPVKEGYTFVGWVTDADPDTLWDFSTYHADSNVTLRAKWELVTRAISFDSTSGSTVSPTSGKLGDKIEKPEDPTRENYVFLGWYTSSAKSAPEWDFSFDTVGGADMTLFAKWAKLGDINQNGRYDAQDYTLLRKGQKGICRLTAKQWTISDMNKNNKIGAAPSDMGDYVKLRAKLA